MRKKLYQAGMISAMLTFGIIAMGCVTKMGVYSPSLQAAEPDTLSHLSIDARLGISGFNGKPVHWGFARDGKSTKIDIPAGLHSFRFEFFDQQDNGSSISRQSASNFTFSYEFMPGHAYKIKALMGGRTIVVFVTDKTDKKLSKTIPLRG
jgi:hypothetical protein